MLAQSGRCDPGPIPGGGGAVSTLAYLCLSELTGTGISFQGLGDWLRFSQGRRLEKAG